ncbi:class I SAM-dependent methyltransferase [candidate division WOR-3 bacterium]|nr:class I SAM-dependent methyltransferase [candidate division WOR-3 bacterium]
MSRLHKPFTKISKYYDILMEDVDYEDWIKYIMDIAELYDIHFTPMLDITCGTGNSMLPFLSKGIKSIGVDSSMEMLKIAKLKVPELPFVLATAQSLPFFHHFNLAISIFDSLNYILDYNELMQAFDSVQETLLPKGHFIFDMNTPYGLETISQHDIRQENENFISVWRNLYNKNEKTLNLYLTLFIKKGELWKRVDEIHHERGYTEDEVIMGLRKTGFKVLGTFKCFEQSTVDRFTKRILYVTKVR